MTHNASVLLIEDHRDIAEMVGGYLESKGYRMDFAADGLTGLHLAVVNDYDVVILDLTLPGIDGKEVCRKLREEAHRDTPLMMLTARDTQQEKIDGLNAGADDYMVKPFDIAELEARIAAMVRRRRGGLASAVLRVADLSLDTGTLAAQRGGKRLNLTPTALTLLTVLMRAAPNVVSRQELEKEVWGDVLPDSDTLRSHLYVLRKVIDKPFEKPLLQTVHGAGYRLAVDDDQ